MKGASIEEIQLFYEELQENLTFLDRAIITLENNPLDKDQVTGILRVAHTIKGNAGFLGLQNLVNLGHSMESLLQEFTLGTIPFTAQAADILLRCKDAIGNIGSLLHKGEQADNISTTDLIDEINSFLLMVNFQANESSSHIGSLSKNKALENIPGTSLLKVWISPQEVAPAIRAFLLEKRVSDFAEILKVIPDEAKREENDFSEGDREINFYIKTEIPPEKIPGLLNIDLIERIEVIDESTLSRQVSSNLIVKEKIDQIEMVDEATTDTVRVPVQRLDMLMNLVGELVIANSGLHQLENTVKKIGEMSTFYRDLREKVKAIFTISSSIQELVMKSRLVPIGQVFSRFQRFVRDYSIRTGKQILLVTRGNDTEIDKRIIDEIIKPLTHLVRNAADHGIESVEHRVSNGKPMEGTIVLSAYQSGQFMVISVEDDGNGLDYEKIRGKAVALGLLHPENAKSASEQLLQEFLFHSGFSTKETITDISGRGYGMDVVRHIIESLNGIIDIQSIEGQGTKISIKLPMTLSIINALIVLVAEEKISIPMSAITETIRISSDNIFTREGAETIQLRDIFIPLIRLDKLLFQESIPFEKGIKKPVVIVENGSSSYGLLIDQFLSRHEMVVKSLAEHYRSIIGISGASILGNGEIVLILDIHGIVNIYKGLKVRYGHRPWKALDSQIQISEEFHPTAPVKCDQELNFPEVALPGEIHTPYKPFRVGSFHTSPVDLKKIHRLFSAENKHLLATWLKQGNANAIRGIRSMTGIKEIKIEKSKGSHFNTKKIDKVYDKINLLTQNLVTFTLPILPLQGEIHLILSHEGAGKIVNLLIREAGVDMRNFSEYEPLLEVTNIMGSAYTNSLTQITNVPVEPGVPRMVKGAAAIRKLIAERIEKHWYEILYIENQFQWEEENISAELLILIPGIS